MYIPDETNVLDNLRVLCREFDSLTYVWTTKNKTESVKIIVELVPEDTMDMHMISEVF